MSWDFGKVRTHLTQLLWITGIFDRFHRPGRPRHRVGLSFTWPKNRAELMVVTIA